MNLNLFVNLGGIGGYQIVSENIISSLRRYSKESFDLTTNLFAKVQPSSIRDHVLNRSLLFSDSLVNEIKDISLAVSPVEKALEFYGEKRILHPMYEGSKFTFKQVKLMNSLDEIWMPCEYLYDVALKHNVKKEKLKLLPACIDTQKFFPDMKLHMPTNRFLFNKPISKTNPFIFLCVGKYEIRKSMKEVVEAFLLLCNKLDNPDFITLKLKFTTTVHARSLRMIKEDLIPLFNKYPKGADRILFVDQTEVDMPTLYNSADCFILASKAEGIGLPLLEAMSCGLPCISTQYASLSHYAKEEHCSVLPNLGMQPAIDGFYGINPEIFGEWGIVDVLKIMESMENMLSMNSKDRMILGSNARKYIDKHYNLEQYYKNIKVLLEV